VVLVRGDTGQSKAGAEGKAQMAWGVPEQGTGGLVARGMGGVDLDAALGTVDADADGGAGAGWEVEDMVVERVHSHDLGTLLEGDTGDLDASIDTENPQVGDTGEVDAAYEAEIDN
jgi:hypothetical protein